MSTMTVDEANAILSEKRSKGRPNKADQEKRNNARLALGFKLVGKKWVKPKAEKPAEAPAATSEAAPVAEASAPVAEEKPAEPISAGEPAAPTGF